jgi:YebC/PmpR family DNA-binding regulatory protein
MSREIAVCVKEGGPDPAANGRLRDLIAKARENNVPSDNVERVIKKAAGGGDGASYENNLYEGYGPSGVAVLVDTLTDNKNRTAGDVRHYFDKFGGNLGTANSVSWQFQQRASSLSPQKTRRGRS